MKHLLLFSLFLMMGMLATAQWTTVANPGFSARSVQYTSLAFSPDGIPYVAYQDGGNGLAATVKKLNGTTWETVGNAGFSAGLAYYTSLAFSPDGVPYVAYTYHGNFYGGRVTVMKFDGSNWVAVGNVGFSAGTAYYTSLAFSPDGVPYVAYTDYGNGYGGTATVMKFDGSNWVAVGNAGFSAGAAYFTSLAFSPDGVPYVAYKDYGNGEGATVMKFTGSAWETVGNAGFSAGMAFYTSLAFSPDGVPYVAYTDRINGNTPTVMKYNSAKGLWVVVGNVGFSAGEALYTSLAISNDGVPYVAYTDGTYNGKATVMKFDGTDWVTVGSKGFSAEIIQFTSLAFSPDGVPYVAYQGDGPDNKATVMAYNTITTGAVNGSFCPGTSVQVNYTAMGYYSSGNNSFTAQLSDASGNFANATSIGTRSSARSGAISATIPSSTPAGSGYRIRVIADHPSINGSDNGQGLTVSTLNIYYQDKDNDGYGNDAVTKQDCSQPDHYVTNNNDCNDNDPNVNPNTVWIKDVDGDGYYTGTPFTQCSSPGAGYVIKNNQQAGDCNDNDPGVHNSVAYYRDADGDGYGSSVSAPFCSSTAPSGYSARTGDLNDNDPAISPRAVEVCGNKVDDDCNGIVDENNCYPCQNGTNLTTTNISSNSAQPNWNATANPQQWQVEYKTIASGSKWVDVVLTGNLRSANISSLKANQQYSWHIKAKCNGKWTDFTSSVTFKTMGAISSSVISSAVVANQSTLGLYPNPTRGQFVVELNVGEKVKTNATIQLTDLRGRTVHTENAAINYGMLKKTMNMLPTLAKGIYVVRIMVNGRVYTTKLIYEK